MSESQLDPVFARFGRYTCLEEHDRARLRDIATDTVCLPARRTVFAEGQRCRNIYLVADGWLAEHRTLADGGRQILKIRLPGEVFGLECLAYGGSLHSVQTLTGCRLVAVSQRAFEALQLHNPRILSALFVMAVFERAIAHEWVVSLGRRPAWSRVAHLLLELRERCALSGLDSASIPFPLTQQDIADCTGLTLGYVNRVLGDMRRLGMIDLRAHELVLCAPEAMARHAGFRPAYLRTVAPAEVSLAAT